MGRVDNVIENKADSNRNVDWKNCRFHGLKYFAITVTRSLYVTTIELTRHKSSMYFKIRYLYRIHTPLLILVRDVNVEL